MMEIECSFRFFEWDDGNLYTCYVKSASTTKRGTKVKSSKGEHQEEKSNADVEAIRFEGLVVEHFPMGLHKIFPNLKLLIVKSCGLKEISRRELIGLEGLTGLRFISTQLKFLPDNLLSGMTKLTRLSFNKNKLEFVSSKLLQPIKNNKLIRVNFDDNPTKIGRFEPGTSGSLGSLQELCDIIDKKCKKPMGSRPDQVAEDFPELFLSGFKELWTSGRLSDFVIACGSKEFQVHKTVLATQSSVLEAAIESNMQESKTSRMEIVDFSKEAVEDFLKYLYTGETPEETNAMEILALASKYNVPALQSSMEEIVLLNIDESNAMEILILANQHNCEFLAQAAFEEIQDMFLETKLDPSLAANPERLKQLIYAKCEYEQVLNDAQRKYEEVLKSCSRMEP